MSEGSSCCAESAKTASAVRLTIKGYATPMLVDKFVGGTSRTILFQLANIERRPDA
jgi:hypothetical protein